VKAIEQIRLHANFTERLDKMLAGIRCSANAQFAPACLDVLEVRTKSYGE